MCNDTHITNTGQIVKVRPSREMKANDTHITNTGQIVKVRPSREMKAWCPELISSSPTVYVPTMKVYVATSLHNADVAKQVIQKFRDNNVEITYDWTTHGKITDESLLKEYGEAEAKGVFDADLLFMIQPARTGAHVEMGIAIGMNMMGRNIPIILVLDGNSEAKTFYYVSNVHRFDSLEAAFQFAIERLKK